MVGRILCVSNKPIAVESFLHVLKQDGYGIDETKTIEKAVLMLEKNNYDLALINMRQEREACETLRQSSNLPIVVLSDSDDEMDEILAIECGADDYFIKPFNIIKAKVRVKALIRRSNIYNVSAIACGANSKVVNLGNRSIDLSPKESQLLHILMDRAGHLISRQELSEAIWGQVGEDQSLKEYIRRLRKKIEPDPYNCIYIINKRGEGYYFNEDYANSYPPTQNQKDA